MKKNRRKYHQKTIKNHQKTLKVDPKMEPGKRLAPGALPGAPGFALFDNFGATWAILDDFGGPLKSKGVPKTDQKIEYGDF